MTSSLQPTTTELDGRAWHEILRARIAVFGHRNWIVVADSAYPAQSRPAIETITSGADQSEVLREVFSSLKQASHVRPVVYLDREMSLVDEADAPGISSYREQLAALLGELPAQSMPHEEIISMMDEAARQFRVLVIKTNSSLPYTSVFLRLECGYWTQDAELRLRAAIHE